MFFFLPVPPFFFGRLVPDFAAVSVSAIAKHFLFYAFTKGSRWFSWPAAWRFFTGPFSWGLVLFLSTMSKAFTERSPGGGLPILPLSSRHRFRGRRTPPLDVFPPPFRRFYARQQDGLRPARVRRRTSLGRKRFVFRRHPPSGLCRRALYFSRFEQSIFLCFPLIGFMVRLRASGCLLSSPVQGHFFANPDSGTWLFVRGFFFIDPGRNTPCFGPRWRVKQTLSPLMEREPFFRGRW